MSLLGALTGSDARRYAQDAYERNAREMQTGYRNSLGYQDRGYQSAVGRLSPYEAQGRQASQAYGNLLGLHGPAAQGQARAAYQGWNPYLADNMNAATRAVDRRAAATGQLDSGMNALARSRVATEMGTNDFYNYNDRLSQLGQQGLTTANVLAGLDTSDAQTRIAIEDALRSGNVQNSTQYGNALAQAGQAGLNNILGIAGLGLGAFMPGVGGQSAASNFLRMFGGGANSLGIDHGYRP